MNAIILDGKAEAAKIYEQLSHKITTLQERYRMTPGLAVILVGNDHASELYVQNKLKRTKSMGIHSFDIRLPDNTSPNQLIKKIEFLNNDPKIHGILVQLPLPAHINPFEIINSIDPNKDVDGFHVSNVGKLVTGQEGFVPCTPIGCLHLIKTVQHDLTGMNATVIGTSNIVGKPMAHLLLKQKCTVTMAHSATRDTKEVVRQADIVVSATGVPNLVKGSWIKPGAIVIDVGINRTTSLDGTTNVVGDVEFSEACTVAKAITPVPGGVGPMTIAYLMSNTIKAACISRNISID